MTIPALPVLPVLKTTLAAELVTSHTGVEMLTYVEANSPAHLGDPWPYRVGVFSDAPRRFRDYSVAFTDTRGCATLGEALGLMGDALGYACPRTEGRCTCGPHGRAL